MAIISSTQYPAIRAALDVQLNDKMLPDAIIALDIYATAADNDVLEIHPTAESETGDDLIRVQNAAVFFCAARLAPTIVRLTSLNIQARDLSYQRPTFDPIKRAEELRQMAVDELEEVLDPDAEAPLMPTMFTRQSGTRGK